MNNIILSGRIASEIELKNTSNQIPFCNFSIAVNKEYKEADGTRGAYFFKCVAWRNTSTFINQYFSKGQPIIIRGSLSERSYDDANGNKCRVNEIIVSDVEFAGPKPEGAKNGNCAPNTTATASTQANKPLKYVEEADQLELPFEI